MSRYCGPRLRIVRRLGELPGLTRKSPKKLAPPGQHGAVKKEINFLNMVQDLKRNNVFVLIMEYLNDNYCFM